MAIYWMLSNSLKQILITTIRCKKKIQLPIGHQKLVLLKKLSPKLKKFMTMMLLH
jgi:hypothetical protein